MNATTHEAAADSPLPPIGFMKYPVQNPSGSPIRRVSLMHRLVEPRSTMPRMTPELRSLCVMTRPSGRRATTSVNVPPTSTKNCHPVWLMRASIHARATEWSMPNRELRLADCRLSGTSEATPVQFTQSGHHPPDKRHHSEENGGQRPAHVTVSPPVPDASCGSVASSHPFCRCSSAATQGFRKGEVTSGRRLW